METKKTKKLNLKNAKYCHIKFDGSLLIYYESFHKDSGKKFEWRETVAKDELPFKLTIAKSYWRKDLENYSFTGLGK